MNTINSSTKTSRNAKWDRAIVALLQNNTREEAAQAAGVNPATLYRWQNDPEFQRAQLEARREVFGQATGRLQQAANTAVDTLIEIMTDKEARGRVQAARCVLELSRKSLELDDLKMQVAELQSWRQAGQERNSQHA
jgi:transposase